eukprot:TRINITY_DN8708_c0_g2_i1.p1 TRINITY_DN8708_c0_g2~~TRINITY_DN8708_c0_g2_i1.p1  ORF type:complete len:584 (+),score=53.55 TRINITY_DN8708_c0_g2_i1:44-1753(+)
MAKYVDPPAVAGGLRAWCPRMERSILHFQKHRERTAIMKKFDSALTDANIQFLRRHACIVASWVALLPLSRLTTCKRDSGGLTVVSLLRRYLHAMDAAPPGQCLVGVLAFVKKRLVRLRNRSATLSNDWEELEHEMRRYYKSEAMRSFASSSASKNHVPEAVRGSYLGEAAQRQTIAPLSASASSASRQHQASPKQKTAPPSASASSASRQHQASPQHQASRQRQGSSSQNQQVASDGLRQDEQVAENQTCHMSPRGELHDQSVQTDTCEHGSLPGQCSICKSCPHGKMERNCVQCYKCPHGKLKRKCLTCKATCPHGRRTQNCRRSIKCRQERKDDNSFQRLGEAQQRAADDASTRSKRKQCPHGKLSWNCSKCRGCPHGSTRRSCIECTGCPHGSLKRNCRHCSGCPHGRVKRQCANCNGCRHGKLKWRCVECKEVPIGSAPAEDLSEEVPIGSAPAEDMPQAANETRRRRQRQKCLNGNRGNWATRTICEHGREKSACKKCKGCPHGNVWWNCVPCCGCPHGKLETNCRQCRGCPHGKVKRWCGRCSGCSHGLVKARCKQCKTVKI